MANAINRGWFVYDSSQSWILSKNEGGNYPVVTLSTPMSDVFS